MTDTSYRDMRHEHEHHPEPAEESRKGPSSDRRRPPRGEGADVGGPRWRIGWGGLADTGRERDTSSRRH